MSSGHPVETNYVQATPVTQIGDTVVTRVSQNEPEEVEQEFAEFVPAEETSHYGVISTGSMNNSSTPETLSLEHHEKEMIIKALEAHRGKRKDAAKALGISERTLYRKINEYGIDL
jgi:DNA-binding NtrC family response regulator